MSKYLAADLRRISSRTPRWVFLAILWSVSVIITVSGEDSLLEATNNAMGSFAYYAPVFALIELIFVYGDDFKAKSMQVAIGSGIPRYQIIRVKWMEFLIALAFDLIVTGLVDLFFAILFSGTKGGMVLDQYLIELFMAWFSANAVLGSLMFIMFLTQGISITLILYMVISTGLASQAIVMFSKLLKLTRFHLQTYFITNCLNTVKARLLLGHISWLNLILVLLYLAIGLVLANVFFKKKELEF